MNRNYISYLSAFVFLIALSDVLAGQSGYDELPDWIYTPSIRNDVITAPGCDTSDKGITDNNVRRAQIRAMAALQRLSAGAMLEGHERTEGTEYSRRVSSIMIPQELIKVEYIKEEHFILKDGSFMVCVLAK